MKHRPRHLKHLGLQHRGGHRVDVRSGDALPLGVGGDLLDLRLMEQWNMRSDYPARLLLDNARRVSRRWCAGAVRRCCEADLR